MTLDGVCKVADFGLARSIHDAQKSGTVGTAGYQGPEIVSPEPSKRRVTKKSDVYAYAFVMFHVISGGVRPWTGSAWRSSARSISSNISSVSGSVTNQINCCVLRKMRPVFPQNTPVELQSFIKQCWIHDYSKFQNVMKSRF